MNNPYDYMEEYKGQTLDYKNFCELVNEPIKEKSGKQIQFKTLSNYMELEQKYGKIIVKKIYDKNELLVCEHRAKFTEYISDLLILYLNNDTTHKITLTYREMEEYFLMVNENYFKAKNDKQKSNWTNELKIPTNIMGYSISEAQNDINKGFNLFFSISDKLMKEIIKNALKSLKQKSLILYKDNFKLYKVESYTDTEGNIKNRVKTIICNKEQREKLLDIRKKLMDEFKIKKLQDIIYLPYQDRELFYDELSYRMSQCDLLENSSRYANAFDIEYGESGISYEAQRIAIQNRKLINSNMEYKLLTSKEMECINNYLKQQLVDKFV